MSSIDVAVIACLRRLQHWTLTSIIDEARILGGRKVFDIEQFIEQFDLDLVHVPALPPEYLQAYITLQVLTRDSIAQ